MKLITKYYDFFLILYHTVPQHAKKNRVTFLENHGVIVCGNKISHTFDDLYYLERCCYVQNIAQSAGKKLKNVNNLLARKVAKQIENERLQSDLHFNALKRIIK